MTRLLMLLIFACCFVVAANAQIVINEVIYDSDGTDTDTWLELLGPPDTSLDGYRLIGINGNGGGEYNEILLNGFVIPADGYFLITEDPSRPDSDYSTSLVDFQNGDDSIALQWDDVGVWVHVDAVGYGAFDGGEVFGGEGTPADDVGGSLTSLARCPDGNDTDDNGADFIADPNPTPGGMNMGNCTPSEGACCFIDGSCQLLTEVDCGAAGGAYEGDDTVCDPNPCTVTEPTDYTLCELSEIDPVTGIPVHQGEYVRASGISLMDSNVWSGSRMEFGFTDGDCCFNAFWNDAGAPFIAEGDEVEVIGTVGFYNGKAQITTPDISVTVLSTGNPLPPPAEVSTFELATNGEQYESCLLKLTCVTIVGGDWPADGSNGYLEVDDGSGPCDVYIDRDTDIDGSAPPPVEFSLVGIGGQFDSSEPYLEGYQLVPRKIADVLYDDCVEPTGACCLEDGTCLPDLNEADCLAQGGVEWLQGLPCDPNPCVPTIPTDYAICEITQDEDEDGFPYKIDEFVRVTGVALMESYVWSPSRTEFTITDESGCCIDIFDFSAIDPPIVRGDLVEVVGYVGFYRGKTQIGDPVITVLATGQPLPAPTPVTTGDLATGGEAYESCLIKLTCVTIVGGVWGTDENLTVDDGTGETALRIDNDTNIPGNPEPVGEFSAIGVAGQYDFDAPYFDGYQCISRDIDDILYDDCLPMTGACCFEDGTCMVLTEAECEAHGGVLWIPEDDCEPNPCVPVAVEETSWGKIKQGYNK